MDIKIENVTPNSNGFQELKSESIVFGFNMLRRLEENWLTNHNRFDKSGEKLSGAFNDGVLIGLCGLNHDPFTSQARTGRLRHLYVGIEWRRMHVGSLLLREVLNNSDRWFDVINTNAPPSAFTFYERAGFIPLTDADKVTHCLSLKGI